MTVTVTKITEATQSTPVADAAALPASVSSADRYVTVGDIRKATQDEITSSGSQSGALSSTDTHLRLNHASAINYTITGAPAAGDKLTIFIATTAAHTVILSGSVTFDGTNQTATFSTAGDSMILRASSATRWDILYNNGATLS